MKEQDYKEKVRIAKEAVVGLDGDLKLKAFEKVLEDLLGTKGSVDNNNSVPIMKRAKKKSINENQKKPEAPEQKQEDIISLINAEDFPEIHNLSTKLDICLYLLKILRERANVDGLIPSQIAKILTDKFRIKADQFNIGMALSKARELLDRDKITMRGGTAYKYKIMKKGEDYIAKKLEEIHNQSSPKAKTSNAETEGSNV